MNFEQLLAGFTDLQSMFGKGDSSEKPYVF